MPYHVALKKEIETAPRPKLAQIATDFITRVGGPKQFATRLADEYNACEPGSLAAQRILQMVMMCLRQDDSAIDPKAYDGADLEDLKNVYKILDGEYRMLGGRITEVNDGPGTAQPKRRVKVQDPKDGTGQAEQEEQVGVEAGLGTEAAAGAEEEESGEASGDQSEAGSPAVAEGSIEDGLTAEAEEAKYRPF